jgi:flagellum-specific peptidoglycan hydrolase FlgJ
MLFIYDKKQSQFSSLGYNFYILIFSIISVLVSLFYLLGRRDQIINYTPYEAKIILSKANDSTLFTTNRFIKELKRLNISYPHIVYAQSLLETGHFKSNIFLEGNNLFGMKQARIRINTAEGTYNGHAYYNSWQESVYDYAFFSCRYLSKISSENEYFEYLSKTYAEDPNYVNKLKSIIEKENLISKFN